MKEITSKDNAIFRHALGLKDKRGRDAAGEYLAEGERLVLDLFQYGFSTNIRYILAEKRMYDRHSTAFSGVETYCITDRLAEKLSDTENGQGLFAVVKIPGSRPFSGDSALFLDRVRDPGNLGTVIRTAAAMGFKDIALSGCADPYAPKVVRAAMGCVPKVNLVRAADLAEIRRAGYAVVCADMNGTPLRRFSRPQKLCLVIGNEAGGISEAVKALADAAVSIETEGVESLNASVAAAILMYELRTI